MKHTNTDKDLFKLITNDNEAAFSELFRRYDRHIYPFVLKMIKSASLAEALTVAIFSKIWQNRKELAFVDVPDEYIYNIACIAIAKQLKTPLSIQLRGISNKVHKQAAYSN